MVLMKILGNFPVKHSFEVPYSSTFANFLGVQKTTHFSSLVWNHSLKSVPAYFELFVYLDVFSITQFYFDNYLSFLLTFVPHHCDCLFDTFWRPLGNLDIDMLVSASALQNFIFPWQIFLKKQYIYDQYNFYAQLFGTSITLLQLLIYSYPLVF